MSTSFTLEFLQEKIGEQYVEQNPLTGRPRIIQGLNEVWRKVDEHGGVAKVASQFGLFGMDVWGWIDRHHVPEPYLSRLLEHGERASDVQLSAVGYEDPLSGECWPGNWKLEPVDFLGLSKR